MVIERGRLHRLDDILNGRQLLIVSNREPYTHRTGPGGISVERPAGGLVAALDPVMQVTSGTWIAWGDGDADFTVTDADARVQVPEDRPRYTLKRIALSKPEVDGYYYGYANQVLWPLCHTVLDQVRMRSRYWETYQAVNRRFAEAVAGEAPRGAIVWLHDYHLATCSRALRQLRPDLFLMHFWHVPWPDWDVFRVCPERAELLDGLLANDLVTFQHERHIAHFFECAERDLGARVIGSTVRYAGRRTRVEAFPISVDASALDEIARSSQAGRWMDGLTRLFGLDGRRVVLSVDRIDYTKGILKRLRAIDQLLARWPEYRSRVVFVQKMAASREQIKAYRDLRARVEERIERLNAAHGTADWIPVVALPDPLPAAGMAALYRLADVCVVSPIQDGMNLVAKEFVACQVGTPGALLLSEFAGAHEELTGSVSINPYDAAACAGTIVRALAMPAEERRQRMDHLRRHVFAHDVYRWMGKHLETAARLLDAGATVRSKAEAATVVGRAALSGRPLALFLDFDGTLVPFHSDPAQVSLPADARGILTRLVRRPNTLVTIVSGRAVEDLGSRIGLDGIVYAGNHGLEISRPDHTWVLPEAELARPAIEACGRRLERRLRGIPGAWLQNKGLTLTVHYRHTPAAFVERVRDVVFEETGQAPERRIAVYLGAYAFEVRPDARWDKGAAVRRILIETFGDAWATEVQAVYIGDDWADEDAFLALPESAITIKVGRQPPQTSARYRVAGIEDVHRLLSVVALTGAAGNGDGTPDGLRMLQGGTTVPGPRNQAASFIRTQG